LRKHLKAFRKDLGHEFVAPYYLVLVLLRQPLRLIFR
jgi:hypothetical protein